MRYLFRQYPIDGPGIPERDGYLAAIREVTGQDLSEFFARYIGGTDELPFDQTLGAAGLKLSWNWKDKATDGTSPRPMLGARTKHVEGQLRVAAVLTDTPAYQAGISADDEIVAVDGYRVTDDAGLRERLNDRKVGERVTLTLFRREEIRTIEVELAASAGDKLAIEPVAQPDAIQQQIYAGWLGIHTQPEPSA